MRLSVRAMLFLALLLASLLAVLGTAAFVQWSLQRGMAELVDARDGERIAEIADRLEAIHAEDGSWDALAGDRRRWIGVLLGRGSRVGRDPRRAKHLPPWLRRSLGEVDQTDLWPPPAVLDHLRERDRPIPLELRLMLLDREGGLVYGQAALLAEARRLPLTLDGLPIGSLALIPRPPLAGAPELQFQARQGWRLGLIAIGMVLISALLALALSRRLVRPIEQLQSVAQRLASGDYEARVPVRGYDEIARLGRDLNALAAALGQTEQSRRRWVADISHELRTPVALLRAELEALQDGIRPLERRALDPLHEDVLRLGRLVDDLYELSMTDLGAFRYRMVDTDLGALLAADLDALGPRFAEAGLGLAFEDQRARSGVPAVIQADPQRLSQLFRNLLANSLQYSDAGGGLRVLLSHEGPAYCIDFQDTAPGVPSEALPRLFERLYRVDGSRSRHTGGAGLGLAIAKNIAEAHGGRIEARASPTGGLWIRVCLPDGSGDAG